MLKNQTVAVVIPAYNEETQIGKVIETMPDFVDRIVIVNDMSKDKTSETILKYIEMEKYQNTPEIKTFQYTTDDPTGFDRATCVVMEKLAAEEKLYTPARVVNQKENTDIVRTDGNEFLIYLVEYDEKQVASYIKKLTKEFKELAHGFGAAIGYSIIQDGIKTVDDAINEATLDMKNNKEETQ